MYIKEVIIDGFKSYATRTVISGFDPQFNAITGLNGSGKSNILDAICFVLGLTTLSLARVNSLQELIYKFGHAGITKASVSIVFDNTDKKSSPVGYENSDTIIVTRIISGGKSKYLLNGHTESNQKVKTMFKTVQLNIDNPHFLVAQGRITKIINLRPQELISMLEETAGILLRTSLYNEKKRESRRIIEKKEEKVKEMEDLLKNDIEPQMEKLRKEREIYLQWKSGQIELEKITRFIRAYEYFEQRKLVDSRSLDLTNLKATDDDIKRKIKKNYDKIKKTKQEIEEYKSKKNSEMFDRYKELESECKSKKKEITDIESELKNLTKSMKDSEKERDAHEAEITELEASITRIDQKIVYLDSNMEKATKSLKEKKEAYENNQRQLRAVLKGDKIVDEDNLLNLNNQLKEAEVNLSNTISEIKQQELKKKHLEQERDQIKASMENSITSTKNLQEEISGLVDEIEKMKRAVESTKCQPQLTLGFEVSNEDYQDILEEKRKHIEMMNQFQNRVNDVMANNPAFKLSYKDPEPNFDRKKVKGRVFQLFSVNDTTFIKPLEAIAGPKVFNIVVDTENTAKLLLKRNCFGGASVYFIPNNKITPNVINEDVIERARHIANEMNGQAAAAYSLIKFDPELKNTMEFVFGGTIICSSTEIAKKIAFDPKIRKRCVNLEGDIFDPAGTLTGGYSNINTSILAKFNEYKQLSNECDDQRKIVKSLEDKADRYKKKLDDFNQTKNDFDLKTHKLDLLNKKLKSTASVKVQDKVENIQLQIDDLNEQIKELKEKQKEFEKEVADLKKDKASASKGTKNTKDILTEQGEKLKVELDKLQNEIKRVRNEKANLEVEHETAEAELKRKKKALTEESSSYQKFKKAFEKSNSDLEQARNYYSKIDDEKRKLDKTLSSVDTKVAQHEKELQYLEGENENYEKELKRIEAQISRFSRELKEAQEIVKDMEKALSWLVQEYDNFGVSGSEYDFDSVDIDEERNRHENIKKDQDNLSKRVNMKVEAMSDKVEKEYKTLIEKKKILEVDKSTLNHNMEELDKKKKEALENCWKEVNQNFGKIFSTLLHGTQAKLQPMQGKDISEGLEIRVAFNNNWKQSLSELSGGQRSLLALSFMLSLLLYKPAPFYILDEIDAALDLSHTENIGAMISQHFPQSQFIIISLKEGMFNNATVLFKTSFVDGVSKVDRIVLKDKVQRKGGKKKKGEMQIEEGDDE